jgi:hypothetical protein
MIQIVMKPEKAPVVNHEGLYGAWMNGHLLFHVRAKNAKHAEEKVMFLMEHETMGKVIDFTLEQFKENAERNPEEVLPPGRAEGASAGPVAQTLGIALATLALFMV